MPHGSDKAGGCSAARLTASRRERQDMLARYPVPETPWLYVIVATGNIYEDIIQARLAASQGADIIAVIRSTGQSLLDYVPEEAKDKGYGGTYANQENFRLMRKALDEESQILGRYIRLVNYCSGLCMPEIAVLGSFERLDMMLNDAMYGILFRDINMDRTLTDQRFSRMINNYTGIIINTGEDNYLTTSEAFAAGPQVLASQFINYHFARAAGLKDELIGLGHAFEIDPHMEDSLMYEIAMAVLVRSAFPRCPVKYMPPTVHVTGNIFFAHMLDSVFNLVSTITGQTIHLLGMLTEAIHTPYMHDRFLSIQAAKYMRKAARNLGRDLRLNDDGAISKRAAYLLGQTVDLLTKVKEKTLFTSIEEGMFAGVRRKRKGGKGKEGIFAKGDMYFNPFEEILGGEGSDER